MDWGITILFQVIKNVPNDAVGELGEGPTGARLDLERFFGDYVDLYVSEQVQFSSEEVKERPDDVIKKIKNIRKRRWKSMIAQCFSARCHVLENPVHPHNRYLDERLLGFLNLGLDLARHRWNKVECVGLLAMLRGSASYFLSTLPEEEQEKKKQEWINGLSKLLFTIGEEREVDDKADDFHIKAHAALALKNLRSGGINESSADLFDVQNWMF